MLEDDLALREEAREIDEQASGRDDGSVTFHLRLDREAE
jgi:hypothetical protein